jgi:hypothetical protein
LTGRFNRLDPFFGNLQDPQSLNKYVYKHSDPIHFGDPSGESLTAIVGVAGHFRARLGHLTVVLAFVADGAIINYVFFKATI